ncbi:MAG: hypothetical protein RDV48_11545 [Candidatus Eremiobacteraeota bacterium]|nr:hypothetical protein [Candidatus Eremiobacteraeota bacterium]
MRTLTMLLIIGLAVIISSAPLFSQVIDNRDSGSQSILDNNGSVLAKPISMNLFYNNRRAFGYMFWSGGDAFISSDAARTLFSFSDSNQGDTGEYMVNGRGVNTYYYGNNLYLDVNDLCEALGLRASFTNDMRSVIFLSIAPPPSQYSAPQEPKVRVAIVTSTNGNNQDPVNNMSWVYTVSLTNITSKMIVLNHYNFIVLSESGNRFVSVKDMSYSVVYSQNDTPDAVMLDPGQPHQLNLIFDLPDGDSPKTFEVIQGAQVLGSVSL